MKKATILALVAGPCLLIAASWSVSAAIDDFRPLDHIINFKRLGPGYHSLRNPSKKLAYDRDFHVLVAFDRIAPELAKDRAAHVLQAKRFVAIPADMTADDVTRAWRDSGGKPEITRTKRPEVRSSTTRARDAYRIVVDSQVATGFTCLASETAGQWAEQYQEVWARHFLLVTAYGTLAEIVPPKCP